MTSLKIFRTSAIHSENLQEIQKDGAIIINGEIENYTELTSGLDPQVITFGLNDSCDYYPSDITFDETACASFTAMHYGTPVMDVKLHVRACTTYQMHLQQSHSLDLGISTDAILPDYPLSEVQTAVSSTKDVWTGLLSLMITHIIRQRSVQH